MAGRDDRHLSMRARNATTRLTEYTATRVRYKARYIRKSSHTVRSGSSVHCGPEQFTRLAAGTGTSLARRQFVSLSRKQTVSVSVFFLTLVLLYFFLTLVLLHSDVDPSFLTSLYVQSPIAVLHVKGSP